MGYSGNLDPDYVFPTAIADVSNKRSVSTSQLKADEYDFYIGNKAYEMSRTSNNHTLTLPMSNGIVENWDLMEKFWHQSIYHYLKADPQEHYFVLVKYLY